MTVNACKNRAATAEHGVAWLQVTDNKAPAATAKAAADANTQLKYTDTDVPVECCLWFSGREARGAGSPTGNDKKQDQSPRQPAAVHPDWNKKIIKNATLSVEVKDYVRFNELVRAAVKQSGDYGDKSQRRIKSRIIK